MMQAVITITHFNGQTFWLTQRCCLSNEEAEAARALLNGMPSPEAFIPHHAVIADADGFPVTGGSSASHHVDPAPDLPPEVEQLAELQSDELPFNGPDSPGEAAP